MLKRSSLINSTTITATGKKTILRLKKKKWNFKGKEVGQNWFFGKSIAPLFNYAKFAQKR